MVTNVVDVGDIGGSKFLKKNVAHTEKISSKANINRLILIL